MVSKQPVPALTPSRGTQTTHRAYHGKSVNRPVPALTPSRGAQTTHRAYHGK